MADVGLYIKNIYDTNALTQALAVLLLGNFLYI